MNVVAGLKSLKCDPGPVHSPNECDMEQPCPCVVQAAAVEEIERLKKWHMDATMMRDALQRENDELREKIHALFQEACKAKHACDGICPEAYSILNLATRRAA